MRSPMHTLAATIAAVGLFLTACGSSGGQSSGTTAAPAGTTTTTAAPGSAAPSTAAGATTKCDPVKPGVLSVVTNLPGPNFWGTKSGEVDPDKIKSGIEYDLATDIAKACGLKMEFRNEDFGALVAGQIAADSYDIALSQVTITPDRAKVVDFSVPYFSADQSLLVKKGTKVSTWDDVKKMKIGVQASTTAEADFLKNPDWKLDHDPQSFPDLTSAYEALSSGQVEGVVIDTSINLGQAAQSNGELEVVAQFKTGEQYGAIYPKGSPKKAVFDGIIKGLVDDGTVTALLKKYLGGDPSTVPFIKVGS
jgi:polar amino acid transport system substrate-binding protein